MSDHIQPTKEQLKEKLKADITALSLEPEKKETPPPPPSEGDSSKEKEQPEKKEAQTPPESKEKPSEDLEEKHWKEKFSKSSQEALVLNMKNKEMNKALENAASLPEPTEDELKKEFPEWEDMTATEKRLAKSNLHNERKFGAIQGATHKFKQVDEWVKQVDTFVDDPRTLIAHPELEGKTEEFKLFSEKPTRIGMDFEDLLLAFSGEVAKNKPAPKKGAMFEVGSAGTNDKPGIKDDKISVEEGANLRKTDYKRYLEQLKAGKIKNE